MSKKSTFVWFFLLKSLYYQWLFVSLQRQSSPSLLTMLNRRQTESNVKLVWTLPRCEGGRALLKLKSGVVLFLYHLWDYCSISLLCNLMIWLSCFDLEGWKSTTLREFPIIYATSVIIGRAVVEHYMTKTGTVEKRKDGAVCTHLFNINRIIFIVVR